MTVAEDVIRVRGLTMGFGDRVVIRDLDFAVRRGEVYVVMGPSGCGKTTLLRHLLGGLVKGATYGLLVALTGTLRGVQAGRSAARVGDAATSAVVTGIVAIIAACGVYQYVFFLFGW